MKLVSFRSTSGDLGAGVLHDEQVVEQAAPSLLSWLDGDGHEPTGKRFSAAEVTLLAPVSRPPSVRDFFAFEQHAKVGARRLGRELAPYWYQAPVFYFSNPAAVHGPDEPVERPSTTRMLDFELEIAAIVDGVGDIAGFTLMNDWSARDIQQEESTVGLGPHKSKDFATSLGPWLVTPDELPYEGGRLHLDASVSINGSVLARTSAADQRYSWHELVQHAESCTTLRAGDVLGSGTLNGGCLLELGPLEPEGRWLEPGDVVRLAAEGLGELVTRIV